MSWLGTDLLARPAPRAGGLFLAVTLGLSFGVQFDHAAWAKSFADIGSVEFPRAVAFALDETAKAAAAGMKARMPAAMGRRTPGGWQSNSFTLQGVAYTRSGRYDDVTGIESIRSSVFIKPKQSAYLKYGFGEGPQTRLPGDVGLAEDVILVPDSQNLFYCTKISGLSPFDSGNMPRDLMSQIQKRVVASRGTPGRHAEAMRTMGREARALGAGFQPGPRMRRVPTKLRPGTGPTGARALQHHLTVAKKSSGLDVREERPLFRRPDVTGPMTIEARPFRARDPAGGYTTFVRRDGTTARMPRIFNISRFDGKAGPRIGPRRLFTPIEHADYNPYLQAPWDSAAGEAYEGFPERMQRELDNRLVRRAQRRRY